MEKKEFKVGEALVHAIVQKEKTKRMLFSLKLIRHVHQFQTTCSIRHDS